MQLHELKRNTAQRKAKRVGRGGRRGKTSGRGTKGQKARSGRKLRPEMRDIIKKIPKRRGFGKNRPRGVNPDRTRPEIVNVSDLERFEHGTDITPALLLAHRLVGRHKGMVPHVKLLGNGTVSKRLTLVGFTYSASARKKLEDAGCTIRT